jgi:hypothetical protein
MQRRSQPRSRAENTSPRRPIASVPQHLRTKQRAPVCGPCFASGGRMELNSEKLTPPDGNSLFARRIVEAIRMGRSPADWVFDHFLPPELRAPSGQHWTPMAVAMRAAEWLDEFAIRTVVDIGSGAGKFCVAAALFGRMRVTGVEQRGHLVAAASGLAKTFDLGDRVSFVHSRFGRDLIPQAEAYYLFNPFGEHVMSPGWRLDEEVEFSGARYAQDVIATETLLRDARPGTYVLTYNGFGGVVPSDYQTVRTDRELPNVLQMWRKMAYGRADRASGCRHGEPHTAA